MGPKGRPGLGSRPVAWKWSQSSSIQWSFHLQKTCLRAVEQMCLCDSVHRRQGRATLEQAAIWAHSSSKEAGRLAGYKGTSTSLSGVDTCMRTHAHTLISRDKDRGSQFWQRRLMQFPAISPKTRPIFVIRGCRFQWLRSAI